MINTNTLWAYRGAEAEIDMRPHFLEEQNFDNARQLTGDVQLRADSEWHTNDRLVEVSERRFAHTEKIIQSVADCLVESLLVEATANGVPVKSVRATVEACSRPLARPGVLSTNRSGPAKLDVTLHIVAEASDETIGKLVVAARRGSPAFDMFANSVTVEVRRTDA